ncbi:MAG: UDP-N-acetylmuramate dehydrogenase [Eggerthellaceae bacterium]|nr:UDP-N-acetylmuramate dehydrogenase [Eggerthellaceae bacterium]
MIEDPKEALEQLVGSENLFIDEPMSKYTTFQIGGPARFLVTPTSFSQVAQVIRACRLAEMSFDVVGAGSDLLIADTGLDGVIILLRENLSQISVEDNMIHAQAGALNADVARVAQQAGLTGFEFASGIPGTVGGAAIMNAGAYDGEFKDVCVALFGVDIDGNPRDIKAEEAAWGYRQSMMNETGFTVLEVTLELRPDAPDKILARMEDLRERRESKQPLEMPSAGSTFKRPEGYFAGKLIQDAGLRGFQLGGAQVSDKHTGFVVNANNANAEDVRALIRHVQAVVKEKFGVELEPEVRMWGFDD